MRLTSLALLASIAASGNAMAQQVEFRDPAGDDNGPGTYTYPTDAVFKAGSFDLTGFKVEKLGDKLNFEATMNATLEDPWRMNTGFSVQMLVIFIDQDNKRGSGFTDATPGSSARFAPDDAWDKAVIMSPQSPERVAKEIAAKAGPMQGAILVPSRTKGAGRKIYGSVPLPDLGGDGDFTHWGYQVVVQSNEGFPAGNDLLTRRVSEEAGSQRFGGGNDEACDPNIIDVLAGQGRGDASEADAQHRMLAYECDADGSSLKTATLKMVRHD